MPEELVIFRLCERFGWTPQELDAIDAELMERFMTIISIENQLGKVNGV